MKRKKEQKERRLGVPPVLFSLLPLRDTCHWPDGLHRCRGSPPDLSALKGGFCQQVDGEEVGRGQGRALADGPGEGRAIEEAGGRREGAKEK